MTEQSTNPSLDLLREIGLRLVPAQPTRDMCRAGSAAGEIDIETVRRIYQAMLALAAEASLHGDQAVH